MLKIGGSVGAENDASLDAVVALNDGGHPLVVVHGGDEVLGMSMTAGNNIVIHYEKVK